MAADTSAQELAQALQRTDHGIRDFSADFVHTYRGGVLRKAAQRARPLLVKKPGKMRWEYTAPEEKLFVSDGVKLYSYIPQDKQVIVGARPARRPGHHAGAVSRRKGQPDARLHAVVCVDGAAGHARRARWR